MNIMYEYTYSIYPFKISILFSNPIKITVKLSHGALMAKNRAQNE